MRKRLSVNVKEFRSGFKQHRLKTPAAVEAGLTDQFDVLRNTN
jgi:hypothetical protein